MGIQQNNDRIQTTHIGSLPRPHDLLDIMKAKFAKQPYDDKAYQAKLSKAVADCVRKQVDCGIDFVTDGEFSKPGFFTYVQERLEGFEARPNQKLILFQKEVSSFPEYYAEYFKQAMMGGTIVPITPVVCVGPVKYRGERLLQIDIENLKAAAKAAGVPEKRHFCPRPPRQASGSTSITKPMKNTFMHWQPN
jgi:5-methyltetrahydropteroyltriglutamate--homocysteine methyltransferase